jgi:tetratricopeptide (TPR) repeat protein
MKLARVLYTLAPLLLSACATLESQSELAAGRQALLRGEPDNALVSFDRAARNNPGFISDSVLPRRSVWTYVGRAHYNAGRYAAAGSAFEKALSYLGEDYVARMYWALTLLRPSAPSAPSKTFNLQEVTFALREGVEPKRVAALARERGVAFDLTQETENQLRTAGADNFLVNELKKLRSESARQAKNTEARIAQGSKELTVALSGLRDWLDDFIRNAPQGRFWDPAQEIRNQVQLVMKQTTAQPANWDTVISNTEWLGSRLEEENDRARRDESAERQRQHTR